MKSNKLIIAWLLFSSHLLAAAYKNLHFRLQPILKPEINIVPNYFNTTFTCSAINSGFDNKNKTKDLGELLFGKNIQLQDIYLTAKLADNGYFKLPDAPFGHEISEQFICCMAKTTMNFSCHEKVYDFSLQYNHRFNLPKENNFINLHFILPVEYHERYIDYKILNGKIGATTTSVNLNPVTQFFLNYNDIDTFIEQEIFSKKNLTFDPYQYKTALGDFIVDIYYEKLNPHRYSFQSGLSITLPTGHKSEEKKLWEIKTTKNAIITSGYIFCAIATPMNAFNIYFNLDLAVKWANIQPMRVATKINSKSDLGIPSIYKNFTILPFDQYDTTISAFADNVICLKSNNRLEGSFAIGNIFQQAFNKDMSALLEYRILFFEKQTYSILKKYTQIKKENINLESIQSTNNSYVQNFRGALFVESQDGHLKGYMAGTVAFAGHNYTQSNSIDFGIDVFF
ncbi:MAG: hypothetical protein NTZ68_04075 [Candidatus Dependentiae bacterium]|nr:hypothetical protein [Candidatus Dependentiae bacterium]